MRANIENMISPDYVLCYIPRTLDILEKNENFIIGQKGGGGPFDVMGGPFVVLEILEKNSRFWNFISKILNFLKILKIMNYNFQSRNQILMLRGVYRIKISKVGRKF